jgi:hypothetical protein
MRVWQRDKLCGIPRYLYGDIIISTRMMNVRTVTAYGRSVRWRNKRRWLITENGKQLGDPHQQGQILQGDAASCAQRMDLELRREV